VKLPDFSIDVPLNALRERLGAPLRAFKPAPLSGGLTIEEIESLAREGLDIPLQDVSFLEDGTLIYKNRRVVLYIRDVKQYRKAEADDLPRFHVSNCDKLQEMRANNRFERYVVATRDTGVFQINLKSYNSSAFEKSDKSLNVCQLCLAKLNWEGFRQLGGDRSRRRGSVANFKLQNFFKVYPQNVMSYEPKHDEIGAPLNDYGPEFRLVADRLKRERGYRCDECGDDLSELKRFLHAHHKNGQQYDNSDANIAILCVIDHAEQYNHGHVKHTANYREYERLLLLAKRRSGD
jgi:hypothetical protein